MKKNYLLTYLLLGVIFASCMITGCSKNAGSGEYTESFSDGEETIVEGFGDNTDSVKTEEIEAKETKAEEASSENSKTDEVIAEEVKKEDTKSEVVENVDVTWEYNVDVSWIDPEKPMVALSFDDGPVSPVNDSSTAIRIQNAISENGMHATFFYWGFTITDHTKTEIQRAYDLGFEIANHTKNHPDLTSLSTEEMIAEVDYMDEILKEISGQEKFLVRPPYLSVNDKVKEILDVPLIGCGLDTQDWNGATSEDIINTIVKAAENGTLDGKIVLMHETYETTAEAVEYLVPYLKELGYQVVSVSEMYCARGKTMKAGKLYNSCAK